MLIEFRGFVKLRIIAEAIHVVPSRKSRRDLLFVIRRFPKFLKTPPLRLPQVSQRGSERCKGHLWALLRQDSYVWALDITSLILEMDVFFNTGRWLHFTMKLNSIETSVITHRVSLEKSITYKSQTSPIHHIF